MNNRQPDAAQRSWSRRRILQAGAMGINAASRISPDGFTLPATHGNPIKALL